MNDIKTKKLILRVLTLEKELREISKEMIQLVKEDLEKTDRKKSIKKEQDYWTTEPKESTGREYESIKNKMGYPGQSQADTYGSYESEDLSEELSGLGINDDAIPETKAVQQKVSDINNFQEKNQDTSKLQYQRELTQSLIRIEDKLGSVKNMKVLTEKDLRQYLNSSGMKSESTQTRIIEIAKEKGGDEISDQFKYIKVMLGHSKPKNIFDKMEKYVNSKKE